MIRKLVLLVGFALLLAAAQPGFAQFNFSRVITGQDPEKVRQVLLDEGYRAKLQPSDEDGVGPTIESSSGGVNFRVRFTWCDTEGANCRALVFLSGFSNHPLEQDVIDTWNRERFSKIYTDAENDPYLEFTVMIHDGLSAANFRDTLNWWASELEMFARDTGWFDKNKPAPATDLLVDDRDA